MKVKKFIGASMQEVMNKIRLEFGQEAVILNSKVVTSNGILGLFKKKTFEVVATIDTDTIDRNKVTFTKVGTTERSPQLKRDQVESPIRLDNAAKEGNDPSKEILNELQTMKKWLSMESKYSLFPTPLKDIHQKLVEIELDTQIREELMDYLLENWRHRKSAEPTKEELSELIYAYLLKEVNDFAVHEQIVFKKKYVNIIGPTGVGKTTTIAKIAAEYVMKHRKQIAFITTDTYRIAAIEQLKTYAEILRIPVEVAYNSEDFKLACERFAHYDHVFIDTAGRNYRNQEFVDDLKNLIDFEMEMETFLVLSATSKQCDMEAIYNQFSTIPLQGVIFTKVDETGFRGSVLNFILKHHIPIIYMTNGQDVPDDIMAATPERIVKTIFGGHLYV